MDVTSCVERRTVPWIFGLRRIGCGEAWCFSVPAELRTSSELQCQSFEKRRNSFFRSSFQQQCLWNAHYWTYPQSFVSLYIDSFSTSIDGISHVCRVVTNTPPGVATSIYITELFIRKESGASGPSKTSQPFCGHVTWSIRKRRTSYTSRRSFISAYRMSSITGRCAHSPRLISVLSFLGSSRSYLIPMYDRMKHSWLCRRRWMKFWIDLHVRLPIQW